MANPLTLAVLAVGVGGMCQAPAFAQTHWIAAPYDPVAHETPDGPNVIQGNALIPLQDGSSVTCSGKPVYLVPVTPYTTERMMVTFNSDRQGYRGVRLNPRGLFVTRRTQDPVPDFQPENEHYERSAGRETRCDSRGDFEFAGIADGDYYVSTVITWQYSGYLPDGGALMSRVSLQGGQAVRVVLAP